MANAPVHTYAKMKPRADGEIYKRPFPNPFTPEYLRGYNDGFDGEPYAPVQLVQNYRIGYNDGQAQRLLDSADFNKMGSSNA